MHSLAALLESKHAKNLNTFSAEFIHHVRALDELRSQFGALNPQPRKPLTGDPPHDRRT